jgi:hypothetical protein
LTYDWGLTPSLSYCGSEKGPASIHFFYFLIGGQKLEVAQKEQKFLLIRQEFNQFAGLPLATKKNKNKKKKEEEEKKKKKNNNNCGRDDSRRSSSVSVVLMTTVWMM